MLNWIVLNRTDYLNENGFGINKTYKVYYAIKSEKEKKVTIITRLPLIGNLRN